MSLKWDDVRVFVALCDNPSLKGAGKTLGIDHSTVSRRLGAMEAALGGPLFERTKEGLVPTQLAEAIEGPAREVGISISSLITTAANVIGSSSGPVRIAVFPILANDFLIPRLPELREQFPSVTFDTMAGIQRVDVARSDADLAIRTHPVGTSPGGAADLVQTVGTFGFAVYASCDYLKKHGTPKRPIRGLAGHSIVVSAPDSPGARWNATLEPPANQALIAFPYASTMAAVINGIGLALLPCLMADKQSALHRISDVIMEWNVWLVSNPKHRENRLIGDIKKALSKMLQDAAPVLSGRSATHPE